MATRTARANTLFDRLPKQVEEARAKVEDLAERTWSQALDLLPEDSRKAVKKATVRLEKATDDLQRRSEKYLKEVNVRRRELVSTIEKRAAQVVRPIIDRLDIATQAEVDRLSRRVAQLEKKTSSKRSGAAA